MSRSIASIPPTVQMKADKRRRAGVANDGDNIAGDEAGEGGGGVVALRGGRIGIFSQQ